MFVSAAHAPWAPRTAARSRPSRRSGRGVDVDAQEDGAPDRLRLDAAPPVLGTHHDEQLRPGHALGLEDAQEGHRGRNIQRNVGDDCEDTADVGDLVPGRVGRALEMASGSYREGFAALGRVRYDEDFSLHPAVCP